MPLPGTLICMHAQMDRQLENIMPRWPIGGIQIKLKNPKTITPVLCAPPIQHYTLSDCLSHLIMSDKNAKLLTANTFSHVTLIANLHSCLVLGTNSTVVYSAQTCETLVLYSAQTVQ